MNEGQKDQFKAEAKMLVDTLFDKGLFQDQLTRDDMNAVEDFIGSAMSMRYESEKKVREIMKKIKDK